MSRWQPIESAPHTGEPILACYALPESASDEWWYGHVVRWQTYHPNAPGKKTWRDLHGHKHDGLKWWLPISMEVDGE